MYRDDEDVQMMTPEELAEWYLEEWYTCSAETDNDFEGENE